MMSCLENDRIYEAAYEDFHELYHFSESFRSLVNKLIPLIWHDSRSKEDILTFTFDVLWKNDEELLRCDKRTAVEALIMFINSMKVFKDEK